MEDKPFFEIKGWLDVLTYISVVLMPVYFVMSMLCASDTKCSEDFKFTFITTFIVCYIGIYSNKGEGFLKYGASFFIWLMGAGAIYCAFPLWTYAIYLICPVMWVIREIWREKHER